MEGEDTGILTCLHNQTRHAISNRSKTSGTINHGTQRCIHQNNTGGTGAQSAANTNTNRQRIGRCSMQLQNIAKTNKSNGRAIPSDQRQRTPKTIQNILATRQMKLCRLLDKAPYSNTTQKHKKRIPNTTHHIGNAATGTATTKNLQIKHLRGCDDMVSKRATDQVHNESQTLGKYPKTYYCEDNHLL